MSNIAILLTGAWLIGCTALGLVIGVIIRGRR